MFGQYFYHEAIRKYVTVFGTLFNDIYIKRQDNAGNEVNVFKVPITYGPKDKVTARLDLDPNLDRSASIILPQLTFQITGIRYANERKLSSVIKTPYRTASNTSVSYVYNPVPYDIDLELIIVVKNYEDGSKVLEQILPYFTPDFTITMDLIDNPLITKDIPIVLNRTTPSDNYEGKFPDRRYILWTLNFTLKGYLYGPTDTNVGKVIKKAIVNIHASANTEHIDERVVVTPGLTANGEPTSNSADSISYLLINYDDDYGYCVDIEAPFIDQ